MNPRSHAFPKRIFLGAWGLGVGALLLPFLFIGESWGMVWMLMAAPLSFIAENVIGLGKEPYLGIGLVSILTSGWWALIPWALSKVLFRKQRPRPPAAGS